MSGPIRRKLGPMVARLKRYIDTAEQEVAPVDATGEVEEKELRRLMKESLNKLTSCSTQVNAEMNKWTDYISRLPQTERITEEKTYETFDDTTNLSEYLDKSTELIDTLKALLAELDDNSDEEDDESTKTDSNQTADTKALAKEDSTTTTYKIRQDIIKLPSIEIKNFNGNHLEFDAFKEAFDAVIDSQPLPPVVKLNYLMNYLEGPAKRSVEGYRIIGSNYDTVRQELSKRFGKMDEIKASLHAELDNLKPAPEGNVHALRNVIESINRVIRQMEAHGEIIDHPHIYTAIMKKIPKSTLKLLLEEKAKSKEWNYSRINEELERIVSLQEAVDRAYAENHAQQLDTQSSQYTTPRATVMSINRAPKTPCSFCNRSHWSQECRTYPAGQSRENRIRELGYCYKCLQTGHYSNKCTKRMVCRLCNRAHHTATCRQDPNYNRNQRRTSQPQQQYQQNRQTPYHQQNRSQNQGQQRQRSNSWSNPSSQQDNRAPQQQQQRQNQQRNQRYVNQKIDQPNIPASLQPRQVHFAHQDEEEISPATGSNRIPLGPARETESNAFSTNSTDHQAMMLTMNLAVYDPARPEEKLNLLAFFDTGSDYSYISSEAMAQLAVPLSDPKTLSLFTFGQQTPQLVETEKCHIGVTTPEGEIELKLRTMPYLTHQIKTVVMDGEKPVVTQVQPQLLIGNDYFWEIISGNPKQLENGFFELDTIFGPLLCGKREKAAVEKFERTITTITTEETEDPDIKQFWSLEGIGITEEEANSDDQTAINFFKQTVQQKDDGRYVVRWPLKEEISTLPHNYNTAFRRLQQTLHRLKKATDPSLIEKYNKTLLDQLKMGITEDVTESTPNGPLHYLPHLPILTPDKTTTKLRVVFDASAKTSNGKCLNDYLLRGPILLPDICGNLLRFRIPKIAIVADVEKAFLQVEIHPDDRDLTRFLWVKDPTKPLTEDNLRVLRYLRVVFGFICSPSLLALVIKHHLENYPEQSELLKEILLNLYVDNVMMSATNVSEGKECFEKSRTYFSSAKMNLREFMSNNKELNVFFEKQEGSTLPKFTKMLGIKWNLDEDTLFVILPTPKATKRPYTTKRDVVREIARVYDPLGLIGPATLPAKIFTQHLWKSGYEWNEKLSKDDEEKWQKILTHWNQEVSFPRQLQAITEKTYQLHVFVDSSSLAYAAVAYIVNHDHPTNPSEILFSKNRLMPMVQQSIPRGELMAMLIGTKMIKFLRAQLAERLYFTSTHIWSDSKCALQWVISKNDKTVFVRNRVRQIQSCKDVTYRYIGTKENPADLATRGTTINELRSSQLWLHGPEILREPKDWPAGLQEVDVLQLTPEIETSAVTAAVQRQEIEDDKTYNSSIDVRRFSKWNIVVGSVMMILQFLSILCLKIGFKNKSTTLGDYNEKPTTRRQKAILFLIKEAQNREPPTTKQQQKFQMYLNTNGLWRCKHRMVNNVLYNHNSYFLPPNDRLTTLIILHNHEKLNHEGVNATLAIIQQQFMIPKTRQKVKRAIKDNCMICRRYQAKPYIQPEMPPLPLERITQEHPFFRTGLDYFGPLWIKSAGEQLKIWVLLLTCFCTRAVHLEIVPDMTTDAFLRAFRRFCARKGCPRYILSDNAKQFKLASELVQGNLQTVQQQMVNKGITWKFIPELSPWMGGLYERMVGIVKNSLRRALGKRILTYDELSTILCECENIVNSRPLTYVQSESGDHILRPCNFIFPLEIYNPAEELDTSDTEWLPSATTASNLWNKWKLSQAVLNKFWTLWHTEYLSYLKERTQYIHPAPHATNKQVPTVNDIVLIATEFAPRNTWPLARIMEVNGSGTIRSAKVKTANGNILTRPVNALFSLELPLDHSHKDNSDQPESAATPTTSKTTQQTQENTVGGPATRTRGRLRQLANNVQLMATVILIMMNLTTANAISGQCTNSTKLALIAQQECVQDGLRIMQYNNGNKCWAQTTCPNGHMRISYTDVCGEKCSCPSWADDCSFYNGTRTKISTKDYPPLKDILHEYTVSICSSTLTGNCCSTPKKRNVFKVQLYDGTNITLKLLHLVTVDITKEDNATCIGTGTTTGSSQYCALNSCAKIGPQICYYPEPPLTEMVLGTLHIPIKAWSHYEITYYDKKEGKEKSNIACSTCHATCETGGIKIASPLPLSPVEICAQARCFQFVQTEVHELLLLPSSLKMYDHEVKVTAWYRGHQVMQQSLSCPADPICELLTCLICMDRLRNLHCTPTTTTILLSIVFLSCIIVIPTLLTVICCLCKTTAKAKTVVHKTWKCCWRSTNSTSQPLLPQRRRINRKSRITKTAATLVVFLLMLPQLTSSLDCTATTSVQSKSHNCLEDINGTLTCTFSEATTLALVPNGQHTCLLLHNDKDIPMGTLTLEMQSLVVKCNRKSEFFTRDHRFETVSSKRCATQGACSGNKCEGIKTTDSCSEFSSAVNSAPGHLFCEAACGCWGCSCGICTSACLFYKVYAVPTTTTIYEVFSCPTYSTTVSFKANLHLGNTSDSKSFQLENAAESWNNMKFEVIASSIPPIPLLASRFLQNLDDRGTRSIGTSAAGQPQPGTVGQLQCTSWDNAKAFNCFFPSSICKCSNADTSANCICPALDHQQLINSASSQEKLPIPVANMLLQTSNNDLIAKLSDKIQLLVTTNNLTASIQSTNNKCNATVSKMKGCYKCILGARATVVCTTNFGTTLAPLTCIDSNQKKILDATIKCSPKGENNTISVFSSTATIRSTCTISCPGGSASMSMHGDLITINTESSAINMTNTNIANDHENTNSALQLPSMQDIATTWSTIISSILSSILNLPFKNILVLIVIALIVIFVACVGVSRFIPR